MKNKKSRIQDELANQAAKDYRRGFRDGKNTKPKSSDAPAYAMGYADGSAYLADVLAKMHKAVNAAAADALAKMHKAVNDAAAKRDNA